MIVSTNMGEQPQLVNLYQFINAFLFEHSPHCDPVFCVCIFVDRLWVFRMWWEFKYIEKAHLNIFRNFAFLLGWDWPLYVVWVIVPWTSPKLSILLSEEIFFRLWAEWSYKCWLPKVFAEDKMCFIHVPEAVKKHWWQALLSPRHPNCNSLLRNLSGTQQHGKETCSLKFMLCTCCRGTMADYEALTALIDVAGLKKEGKVRWWFNGIVMALMIMLMWNPQISVVVAHEQHGCLDVIVLSSRSQWWTPPLACLSTKSEWRG